jgi:hypothetical protein
MDPKGLERSTFEDVLELDLSPYFLAVCYIDDKLTNGF